MDETNSRLIIQYKAKTKTCIIKEGNYVYMMPYAYSHAVKRFLKIVGDVQDKPIDYWYNSLRDIEKRIVEKIAS